MLFDSLKAKVVVIAGASAGVGEATALRFADAGARVVLIGRRQEALLATAQKILAKNQQAQTLCYALDINDAAAFDAMLHSVVKAWGRIDVLVNNAAMHARGPLREIAKRDIGAMVTTNLAAPIMTTRLALDVMAGQVAAPTQGVIINVASLAGRAPVDGAAVYSATKFGLRAFTYAMDEEMRDAGLQIRCCVISPGPINTHFIMDNIEDVADATFSQALCEPDDVAALIVASSMDGKLERCTGGRYAPLLTHIGYLFPALKRKLKPALVAKGRSVKLALMAKRG